MVLLDTHAILHRAYHALPDFTSPAGEPTGALYGLALMLFKIIDELRPLDIIAAYDLPGGTHRHSAFEAYKATRVAADDALIAQLERSRALFDALDIPRLEAPGFEADDILGTLVEQYKKHDDVELIIASGDMDTLQLVDERVRVYTLRKGLKDTVLYDADAVRERYGFGPESVADYKGLRGDPSDNIPGVRGIGEKTATELIVLFGSLEHIYDVLRAGDEAFLAKGVKKRTLELLREGEDEARFSKELATIRRDAPVRAPTPSAWRERADLRKALALFDELGFKTLSARLRDMLGDEKERGREEHGVADVAEAIDASELAKALVGVWLLNSERTTPALQDLLEVTNTRTFSAAHKTLMDMLRKDGLMSVYERIELPLIPVVERMEARGILLDRDYLRGLSERYHTERTAMEERIYTAAGGAFNINSPKQLGDVLFDTLKVGAGKGKRTATGQRSTREDELQKLAGEHPIVADILEYRELQKLLSTYIDNLPRMADEEGRLHAHFLQTGTVTGRMSSQAPNLQNIPIKTPRGAAIRRGIVAPEGYVLLAADYSQIELRVAAFLAEDEKLIEVFKAGGDVHTAVAAQVFGVPEAQVDKEMRRRAKVINFGILYGMGANALAVAAGISRTEAQTYLAEYFARFTGIAAYVERVKHEVRASGYTTTYYGRRRYFPGIRSPLPYVVAQAERMAQNAPIQGTQADIIKLAMVRIDEALRAAQMHDDAYLILQVHDELVYEVRESVLSTVAALVREHMEGILTPTETKGVPLAVDIEVGPNWGELAGV